MTASTAALVAGNGGRGQTETADMQVNKHSQSGWQKYDPESIPNTTGGIHHGASAVRNLRAIGEDAMHLLPDRAIEWAANASNGDWTYGVLQFLFGLFLDALEIVAFPFMVVKNLIDAAAHGFASIGNDDGEAAPIDDFEWKTPSSVGPQILREPRVEQPLPKRKF